MGCPICPMQSRGLHGRLWLWLWLWQWLWRHRGGRGQDSQHGPLFRKGLKASKDGIENAAPATPALDRDACKKVPKKAGCHVECIGAQSIGCQSCVVLNRSKEFQFFFF